jgi:hypothetical protein
MLVYIPSFTQFLLINNLKTNKQILMVYNYKTFLFITLNFYKYLPLSNNIIVKTSTSLLFIEKYFFSLINFFFKKIIFKGKGYKIIKKKKFLILLFNTSNITYLLLFNTLCVKKSKTKYLLILKNALKLNTLTHKVLGIKTLNTYTKRGLRLSKQLVYQKSGKSS